VLKTHSITPILKGKIFMALVRYRINPSNSGWTMRPFVNNVRSFEDFDRLFNQVAAPLANIMQSQTAANLYETDENIVLEMAVPGVLADDINISIEGRQLTVEGAYPTANTDDAEGSENSESRRYWLQNMPTGNFSQTINLPSNVNLDDVQARVTHGILTLTMPKVDTAKARRIAVASE
jgi:HSP20 family protein